MHGGRGCHRLAVFAPGGKYLVIERLAQINLIQRALKTNLLKGVLFFFISRY